MTKKASLYLPQDHRYQQQQNRRQADYQHKKISQTLKQQQTSSNCKILDTFRFYVQLQLEMLGDTCMVKAKMDGITSLPNPDVQALEGCSVPELGSGLSPFSKDIPNSEKSLRTFCKGNQPNLFMKIPNNFFKSLQGQMGLSGNYSEAVLTKFAHWNANLNAAVQSCKGSFEFNACDPIWADDLDKFALGAGLGVAATSILCINVCILYCIFKCLYNKCCNTNTISNNYAYLP